MLYVLLLVGLSSLAANVSSRRLPFERKTHPHQRQRSSDDGLLPRNLIPYHYDLDITPNFYLDEPPFPFDGTVKIYFECIEATDILTVNSYGLSITSFTTAVSPDSPTSPPSPIVYNWQAESAADFLHAYVTNAFVPGAKYVATISYTGVVNSYEYGLYWDSYVSSTDGTTKYILSTQNEEIGAREMFPCFDEPDLKATFNITVAHLPTVTALSNMPVINTLTRPNDWVASVYAQSPIMSTYQVCISIGDLLYVEGNWQGILNYPVRIYSRPDIIDQMKFAANVTVLVQKWLETETGIEYNLPKIDHIALPSKGGAMENWGLITYGEPYFAVNDETSPASQKQLAASFMAHEIAHQWYGNLVTCQWWTDIWLNEGFATYYDYRPLEPLGWPVTEPSQLDTQYFMDSDQLNTSDPVRKQIDTVWDSWYSFAGSTYPKGGAMVYFLEGILGKSTFRAGLTRYLNAYSYSTATTDNLWQSLTDQAADEGYSLDVKTVMDPWLNQMGFPLVTVLRHDDGTATVTQTQFLHPPGQEINDASQWNYKWTVPLTVVKADSNPSDWDGRPTDWLNIGDTELVLTGLPTNLSDWVLVNPKQRFFYRVNYDDANLAAIVNQLVTDHTVFDHETRSNIIDDSFTLARSTYIMETAAMETTRYLANELSYNPWYATLKYITQLNRRLRPYSWFGELGTYMLNRLEPVYTSLGWIYHSTEVPDDQLLRRDIIAAVCAYGQTDCALNARADFHMYKENPDINSVNPTNLPTVLCRGVAEGQIEDWMLVFTQYQNRRTSFIREERWAYLYALACTNDSAVLDSLLSYIVRGVQIATRDQYRATLYLSMNPVGADKVFNYLDNSWSTVPSGLGKFTILGYITSSFTDQTGLDKLKAFIAKNPPQSDAQLSSFNQMILTVQQNINWYTANNQSLKDWLVAINGATSTSRSTARQMPASPLDYWYSMDTEVHSEQKGRSLKY